MASTHMPINKWMDKENMVFMHDRLQSGHEEEWKLTFATKMDVTRSDYIWYCLME